MKSVSIVLSCYNRGKQLRKTLESIEAQKYDRHDLEVIVVEDGNDGLTEIVARDFKARYFRTKRTDLPAFQNPSRVHNIGIKHANGEVVILQGGEVMYETKPYALNHLVELASLPYYVSPIVKSLGPGGEFLEWYSHPREGARAGWIINFCLAVRREYVLEVGGFEESYTGYGFEDDQLTFCLRKLGLGAKYAEDVIVSHQHHSRNNYNFEYPEGLAQFNGFVADVNRGLRPAVSNYGKDWGRL